MKRKIYTQCGDCRNDSERFDHADLETMHGPEWLDLVHELESDS